MKCIGHVHVCFPNPLTISRPPSALTLTKIRSINQFQTGNTNCRSIKNLWILLLAISCTLYHIFYIIWQEMMLQNIYFDTINLSNNRCHRKYAKAPLQPSVTEAVFKTFTIHLNQDTMQKQKNKGDDCSILFFCFYCILCALCHRLACFLLLLFGSFFRYRCAEDCL